MLNQDTIQKILGINETVSTTKEEMAKQFIVTFSPYTSNASFNIINFGKKLRESFSRIGVQVIPYEDSWIDVPMKKRLKRFVKYGLNNIIYIFRSIMGLSNVNFYLPIKTIMVLSGSRRIKKGICVICLGEHEVKDLQMQHIASFKDNSIITIIDFPSDIDPLTPFKVHFEKSMKLFAYHMTNIILSVDDKQMMVYNFNASHPIYSLNDGSFDKHILETLIPKVVAPISPHKLNEFNILNTQFDPNDRLHFEVVEELRSAGRLFSKTKLYPNGKKIDELPFRHNFHKHIGKLHLDNRSGMSFGFLAFQIPQNIAETMTLDKFRVLEKNSFINSDMYIDGNQKYYILLKTDKGNLVVMIPDIWVMTLRSGSDKTNFNPNTDLIKIGLHNGIMQMQFPINLEITTDSKPSFDTKVILAHAVGNAIIASVLKYFDNNNFFSHNLNTKGMAISHWHGYFNSRYLPRGITMYGEENPHVSCSSPQSAIYALQGKLSTFIKKLNSSDNVEYMGDIHIEPHHGINVTYSSLTELAQFILDNPESTTLGNKYLTNQ